MLTRLKVSGFKNLVDVDVRFGPFTCIAGANASGKSNLFDAIRFLSAAADQPLLDAARSVRDEEGRRGDIRSLFHHHGNKYSPEISFEAEMIVPPDAVDDLGQTARATITFLRYGLTLAYRADDVERTSGSLEIVKEELVRLTQSEARQNLAFPHSTEWRKSVVQGRRASDFISTEMEAGSRIIKRHQDGGGRSRPVPRLAATLPRTVLSAANADESPTALVARREMQSWRLLHLEPAALRKPDEFSALSRLGADGSHLPATLYRLAHPRQKPQTNGRSLQEVKSSIYSQAANRLAELIADVKGVGIDRDEKRELLTLYLMDRSGTAHPARSLSDGTLRFLALTVLELDPEVQGLICLEEPENGIHPARISAMLRLLMDLAVDPFEPVEPGHPLRQVIVNTHSPAVVQQVPDDSLLGVETKEVVVDGERFQRACFSYLPETWRAESRDDSSSAIMPKGKLLAYLNPVPPASEEEQRDPSSTEVRSRRRARRVRDRKDVQPLLFPELAEP